MGGGELWVVLSRSTTRTKLRPKNVRASVLGFLSPSPTDPSFEHAKPSWYGRLPTVYLVRPSGAIEPAPYVLNADDVADLFRLLPAYTRFSKATLRRYRKRELKCVRVGRRTWYALPDVLDFLDAKQARAKLVETI